MSGPRIRVGIGGWVFPPWRGAFYPPGLPQARELAHASRQVTAIEINGTFYGSQKPASFRRWHDETPDDFVFSLKAHRVTTNRKDLTEVPEEVKEGLKFVFTERVEDAWKEALIPLYLARDKARKYDEAEYRAERQNRSERDRPESR